MSAARQALRVDDGSWALFGYFCAAVAGWVTGGLLCDLLRWLL